MNVPLAPFTTPNFVSFQMPARPRQEGMAHAVGLPIAQVPAEDLAKLCDDFRAEVFRKAGKTDPAVKP